jgi:hypothetical protein
MCDDLTCNICGHSSQAEGDHAECFLGGNIFNVCSEIQKQVPRKTEIGSYKKAACAGSRRVALPDGTYDPGRGVDVWPRAEAAPEEKKQPRRYFGLDDVLNTHGYGKP